MLVLMVLVVGWFNSGVVDGGGGGSSEVGELRSSDSLDLYGVVGEVHKLWLVCVKPIYLLNLQIPWMMGAGMVMLL